MKYLFYGLGIVLIVGGLAYRFAALEIFNALISKDPGVRLAAADLSYGTNPRQRYAVYRPESQGSAPLPMLIFVHGGGWDSGGHEPYDFAARAFAAQGYVTAVISYRLVPEHLYPAFVDDIALAAREIQRRAADFEGDPERIYFVGHSAGGYNILQAVMDQRFLARAGLEQETIKAIATLAAPADFLPLDSPKSIAAFSHHSVLTDTQPITFARGDAPPILLLHGSDDQTVGTHNSRNLAKKIREASGLVQYTEYPGVGHVKIMLAIAKPLRGDVPVLADILRFFAAHK